MGRVVVAEPVQSVTAVVRDQSMDRAVVFISYARGDQEFAKHLAQALQLKAVGVCADWQLVKGENYQDQLDDLMLGADAVIFIVSPDSLGSPPCRSELDRAAGQHKRILPVVHRDLDSQKNDLPTSLSLPQWTFMRQKDDFVTGIQGLVEAIHTDFGLMPEHRRLLQAAEIWQRNNRSASYLLRKDALKRTEAWRTRTTLHPDKLPKPTSLQLEYIRASELARTRGSRIAFAVVALIAIAMSALAVVAVLQRDQAKKETAIAEAQTIEANRQKVEANHQKGIAEGQTKEANRQKAIAQNQTRIAREQKEIAEAQTHQAKARELGNFESAMLGWSSDLRRQLSRQAESGHEEKHAEADQAFPTPPDAAMRLAHLCCLLLVKLEIHPISKLCRMDKLQATGQLPCRQEDTDQVRKCRSAHPSVYLSPCKIASIHRRDV